MRSGIQGSPQCGRVAEMVSELCLRVTCRSGFCTQPFGRSRYPELMSSSFYSQYSLCTRQKNFSNTW